MSDVYVYSSLDQFVTFRKKVIASCEFLYENPTWQYTIFKCHSYSSSSRSHLVVVSPRQTQFSSSQLSWTSSFVVPMALMSRLTVHPSLLRSFFSQMVPCQEYFFDVFLVSPLDVQTTSIFLSGTSVVFCNLCISLMSSFLTWSRSVQPHAHLHILLVESGPWYSLHPAYLAT